MKIETYILDSSKNCYDLIGILDTFQLDDTVFGTIMINFNENKAFVLQYRASLSEQKILLEQRKLTKLLEKYGITYDALISKVITPLGLEIDGDVIQLRSFLDKLSEVKRNLKEENNK